MVALANRVRVNTSTTGTGTVTLGTKYSNAFVTFAEGGITDGQTVAYCIEDGNDFEVGTGVYTSSGTTMTRAAVTISSISGTVGTTKLTLSGTANVRIVLAKEHAYYAGCGAASNIVAVADGGTGQTSAAEAVGELTQALSTLTNAQIDFNADLVPLYDASADTGVNILAGSIAPYIFTNLATDIAGQNVNTNQSWFPSASTITLASNTTYRISGLLWLSRSAGTTSHTTSFMFGSSGGLVAASQRFIIHCKTGDTTASAAVNSVMYDGSAGSTGVVVKAASTSATEQILMTIEGTMRITTGGGLTPQFCFSAAPGGVPTIKANSYFEMAPIGTDLVVSAGTWA